MKISQLIVAVLCAGALLSGCKGKDGAPGPAGTPGTPGLAGTPGPAGPNLTGTIIGFVNPVDEFNRPQTKSGVTVTLENVTPAVTATTDANGRFELPNVRNGTYNIVYTKAGFGTNKTQGYPHLGGDQPTFLYNRELTGISTTTVPTVTIGSVQPPFTGSNYTNDYVVPITATLANSNQPIQSYGGLEALVFVGNSNNVTSTTGIEITSLSGSGQTYLTRSSLNQRGFATGTTAYAILYGAPYYSYDNGYTDLLTGRRVYTSLSQTPSRVVSFIVP